LLSFYFLDHFSFCVFTLAVAIGIVIPMVFVADVISPCLSFHSFVPLFYAVVIVDIVVAVVITSLLISFCFTCYFLLLLLLLSL